MTFLSHDKGLATEISWANKDYYGKRIPHNLGSLLEKNGFIKIPQVCMSGMHAHLKELKVKGNEDVTFEKKPISKITEYADLLASAYGFGESVEAFAIRSKLIVHSGDCQDYVVMRRAQQAM